MRREWMFVPALVIASALTGFIAWSGTALALPVSIAMPALWSMARHRSTAALVAATYFLAASHGLPQGVATYFQADLWLGIILWLSASLAFVFVHWWLWTERDDWSAAFRYGLIMLLLAVPPFGILGWAHPITASGVVFPGWAWLGLAAMAAGLALMTTRYWPAAAVTLSGFWLWSAAFWSPLQVGEAWQGVDFAKGEDLGREMTLKRHRDLLASVVTGRLPERRVLVLPESVMGFWTPTVSQFWQEKLRGAEVTIIAGATIVARDGYDNVMVSVTADEAAVLYRQRMPVPVAMWRPWLPWTGEGGGAQAHLFGPAVADIAGSRVAILICYEQLIVWPILQSMLHAPDRIVLVGNGWWTAGTNIVDIQRASAEAWSKLFAVPLVLSFNTETSEP
ncbi:conjugal transfer protein TraB [Rhizobium sp. AAP43]|uniref:conjugal transfer protein TraB n=1 Tax=Rhizobium sp. AAP43 TaxID=1523420 RepID=UPI0006B9E4D6|nr:conjugal transfer protein TraB [Rhizobium sp. AAP43]KPF42611.1 conjugal transfer protein TraB [Rhizobium sp. AAP43]